MPERATFIVDLFEQHLDELGFLFGRWRGALHDADYSIRAAGELEERIRGHLQGVQVPGEKAWPRLLEALEADDAGLVFAAAYALLQWDAPELNERVLAAFAGAEAERFEALALALAYAPVPAPVLDQVRTRMSALPAGRGARAAEVLAFHDALQLTADQLRYFLDDEDVAARRTGWRIAGLLGVALPAQAYAAALRDAEPGVAALALEAGAWAGVLGVLPALRHLLTPPTPDRLDALCLLAVLGTNDDLPRLQHALLDAALGPERFRVAASAGAPALIPLLLDALSDPDPAVAANAGTAFTWLTDVDVASAERAALPPPGGGEPDAFEAEFLDEVTLPDPVKARQEWERLRPQLERLPRICRGIDAARALRPEHAERVDMQARYEWHLRARFTQQWQGTRLSLERFPQGLASSAAAPPTASSAGGGPDRPSAAPPLHQR